MKKLILSLFLTFTLLILSNVESKGQCATCPSGYTSKSVNHVLSNGCEITINYCIFCGPTGHGAMKLCSITIPYHAAPNPCYNMVIDGSFWQEVKHAMVFNAAVECGNIGPCPQRVNYEIYQASCWKLDIVWGQFPRLEMKPCPLEAGECLQEFEICWNPTGFVIDPKPPVLIDPGECTFQPIPIDPDPTKLYLDCFNSCWNL